jgi:hypothetical protein
VNKVPTKVLLAVTAAITLAAAFLGCGTAVIEVPIETSFAFTNLSRQYYAALQIRPHSAEALPFFKTALLPPGAAQREHFLVSLGESCPTSLDLRVFLYRRLNENVPIGLDADEMVEAARSRQVKWLTCPHVVWALSRRIRLSPGMPQTVWAG